MTRVDPDMAFVLLIKEVDRALEIINQKGADAFQRGDYENANLLMDKARKINETREYLQRLASEWDELLDTGEIVYKETKPRRRKAKKKLKKGLRAPQELYRVPLLHALVELGGSGTPREVEELSFPMLKTILTDYDYKPLASFGNKPRWTHRLAWTRYDLVQAGHLSPDSPRGVWEITEAGRKWLADNQSIWPG